MNFKKGISPLIATVLVIGFTVALAAVILTWGQTFSKNIQKNTETSANIGLTCAQDVKFSITNVCQQASNGALKVTIQNDGNIKINKFALRLFAAPDVMGTAEFATAGIDKFGIKTEDVTLSGDVAGQEILKIEAVPIITIDGKEVTCTNTIINYGDLNDPDAILECTS